MTKFEDAMTKKQYKIYRMWHESTPGIRYVGLTTVPLIMRLCYHISDCCHRGYGGTGANGKRYPGGNNEDKIKWILSLLEKGLAPHIDELEALYGTFAEARTLENHWMMFYLSDPQYTLLNAKLPKQAQTLVERTETPPVPDTTNYEQNNKNSIITESFGPIGYINYDATLDRFQGTVYISPNRQLTSPLPNYFTLACDYEK